MRRYTLELHHSSLELTHVTRNGDGVGNVFSSLTFGVFSYFSFSLLFLDKFSIIFHTKCNLKTFI